MIEVAGPPSRWIARDGKPAGVLDVYHGMPSYETDTGTILVYDLIVATEGHKALMGRGRAIVGTQTMLFPRGYGGCAVRSALVGDHELVALHDDPDAAWDWRPLIYTLAEEVTRLGSQQELEWRWSLCQVEEAKAEEDDWLYEFVAEQLVEVRRRYGRVPPIALAPGETGFRLPKNARKRLYREYAAAIETRIETRRTVGLPFQDANERAQAILREHLNPQQRLDLEAVGQFYVRGTVNRLYAIRPGNGAAIVSPETHVEIASLCLHPERWMPHADVALATKLAIESGPGGEEEILAGARVRWFGPGPAADPLERAAWERERELLPSPVPA